MCATAKDCQGPKMCAISVTHTSLHQNVWTKKKKLTRQYCDSIGELWRLLVNMLISQEETQKNIFSYAIASDRRS